MNKLLVILVFVLALTGCKSEDDMVLNQITISLEEYESLKSSEIEYQDLKWLEESYNELMEETFVLKETISELEKEQEPDLITDTEQVKDGYTGLIESRYHNTDFIRDIPSIEGRLDGGTVKWTHLYNVIDSHIDEDNISWFQIELDNGRTGWIESRFTEKVTENEEYTNVAKEYATILNNRDMDALGEFLEERGFYFLGDGNLDYVLKHLEQLYGSSKIIDVKLNRKNGSQNYYLLTYDSGQTHEITISDGLHVDVTLSDYIIYNSYYLEKMMDEYVEALKERDWGKVLSIHYPVEYEGDEPEYNENWLYRYELYFDVPNIEWKLVGLSELWDFDCVIYGEKNSQYFEHAITVGTGDSFIWIEDDFLEPEFVYWDWD